MRQYDGQQLTTGDQAEVYADHFIANHLKAIGGGKTYAQLSAESLADPKDVKLRARSQTMFKGETLRGLLLNAYAFGKMGTIAGIAAVPRSSAAALMLLGPRPVACPPRPRHGAILGDRTPEWSGSPTARLSQSLPPAPPSAPGGQRVCDGLDGSCRDRQR